ncbi:YwaF family protein [Mycoplasma sp. CH-Wi4]|nr:YwaF family protein [Mycoplasma tauri]MBZ4204370.1 YwaF family protein [Mycoplasma tauri]MBZ4218457.1 YwaF family protein [Mycoplasma tauri]
MLVSNFFRSELLLENNIAGTWTFKNGIGAIASQSIFYLLVAFFFVSAIIICLFRKIIKENYSRQNKILFMPKHLFWRILGLLLLLGIVWRGSLVYIIDYEYKYEVLPFHLCRIMILFISISFIFNKIELIKYYGFIAVPAAIIALFVPNIGVNTGADNYWFWDYLLAHLFVFIMPFVLFAISTFDYKFKDSVVTQILFVTLCLTMFVINYITNTLNTPKEWKTNYFYFALDEYNDILKIIPFLIWPFHILIFIFLGIVLMSIFILFWILSDKFYLYKSNEKIQFYKSDSKMWIHYKESFKNFFKPQNHNLDEKKN